MIRKEIEARKKAEEERDSEIRKEIEARRKAYEA